MKVIYEEENRKVDRTELEHGEIYEVSVYYSEDPLIMMYVELYDVDEGYENELLINMKTGETLILNELYSKIEWIKRAKASLTVVRQLKATLQLNYSGGGDYGY